MSKRPKIEVGPLPTPESIQAPAFAGVLSAAAARSAQQAKLRVKQWIGGTAVVLMLAIGVAYWLANRPSALAPEPPNLAPGQTLVPGVELPTLRVVFNAEAGADLALSDGTTIRLKPNALRHPDGTPVTGPVELVYVPMRNPAHFALSGIQMEAPTPGRVLESAAMFQLECNQQGQPLELDPALPVEMTLPSRFADDGIKLYKYDRATQAWAEAGVSRPAVRFTFHETYPGIFRHPLHRTAWETADTNVGLETSDLFRTTWTKVRVVNVDSVLNSIEFEVQVAQNDSDLSDSNGDLMLQASQDMPFGDNDLSSGRNLFRSHCASCHNLTNQRGKGPGLAGALARWNGNTSEMAAFTQMGAMEYIQANRAMSGYIRRQVTEYGAAMPAQTISEAEAMAILDYISTTMDTAVVSATLSASNVSNPQRPSVRFRARPVGTSITATNLHSLVVDFEAQQSEEYNRRNQIAIRAQDSLMRLWVNQGAAAMMENRVLQVISLNQFGVWNCDREITTDEVLQLATFSINGAVMPADSFQKVVSVWPGRNTAVYSYPMDFDWTSNVWQLRLPRLTNEALVWVVTRGGRLGKATVNKGAGTSTVALEMLTEVSPSLETINRFLGMPPLESRPPRVVSGNANPVPTDSVMNATMAPAPDTLSSVRDTTAILPPPETIPEGRKIRFCVWVAELEATAQ